ncbi:hypothetical protein KBD59_01795 [Candidatus Gracilibacteria bacterium]|nr:hypothetical protein [Candidatus Gracilibacteria bacterium]
MLKHTPASARDFTDLCSIPEIDRSFSSDVTTLRRVQTTKGDKAKIGKIAAEVGKEEFWNKLMMGAIADVVKSLSLTHPHEPIDMLVIQNEENILRVAMQTLTSLNANYYPDERILRNMYFEFRARLSIPAVGSYKVFEQTLSQGGAPQINTRILDVLTGEEESFED